MPSSDNPGPRRADGWPIAWLVGAVLSIAGSVLFLDGPVAHYSARRFTDTVWLVGAYYVLDQTPRFAGLLALFAVGCGIWIFSGRELPRWAHAWLRAALATGLALGVALTLKFVIGRPSVRPLLLAGGTFAFQPFARGITGGAFPSATMAAMTGFFAGFGLDSAHRRVFAGLVISTLAACLVITNGHWFADILGGIYLGLVPASPHASRLWPGRAPRSSAEDT